MARKRTRTFSVVKAVKANARRRVGQPKTERVIEDKPRAAGREAKHKPTLGNLLDGEAE